MKLKRTPGLELMVALAGLMLTAGLAGCSAQQVAQAPQSAAAASTTGDLSGLWTGTIRVTPCFSGAISNAGPRCNAVNNITFTLVQNGSQLTGGYTCATGTYVCRNGGADDSGKITSGSVSGERVSLQVMIPADVSNCYFTGTSPALGTLTGTYTCYNGGQFVEQGMWQVGRE